MRLKHSTICVRVSLVPKHHVSINNVEQVAEKQNPGKKDSTQTGRESPAYPNPNLIYQVILYFYLI